jgi:hypothetical protein
VPITYAIEFSDETRAKDALRELESHGLRVQMRPQRSASTYLVKVIVSEPRSHPDILTTIQTTAAHHDGEYVGEAGIAIVPLRAPSQQSEQ